MTFLITDNKVKETMKEIVATKNGKLERFVVEVLAIPASNGDPTFTVRISHPHGQIYSQSRTHESASKLFERSLKSIEPYIYSYGGL